MSKKRCINNNDATATLKRSSSPIRFITLCRTPCYCHQKTTIEIKCALTEITFHYISVRLYVNYN